MRAETSTWLASVATLIADASCCSSGFCCACRLTSATTPRTRSARFCAAASSAASPVTASETCGSRSPVTVRLRSAGRLIDGAVAARARACSPAGPRAGSGRPPSRTSSRAAPSRRARAARCSRAAAPRRGCGSTTAASTWAFGPNSSERSSRKATALARCGVLLERVHRHAVVVVAAHLALGLERATELVQVEAAGHEREARRLAVRCREPRRDDDLVDVARGVEAGLLLQLAQRVGPHAALLGVARVERARREALDVEAHHEARVAGQHQRLRRQRPDGGAQRVEPQRAERRDDAEHRPPGSRRSTTRRVRVRGTSSGDPVERLHGSHLLFEYVLARGKDPGRRVEEQRPSTTSRTGTACSGGSTCWNRPASPSCAGRCADQRAQPGRERQPRQVAGQVREQLPAVEEHQAGDHRPLQQHAEQREEGAVGQRASAPAPRGRAAGRAPRRAHAPRRPRVLSSRKNVSTQAGSARHSVVTR